MKRNVIRIISTILMLASCQGVEGKVKKAAITDTSVSQVCTLGNLGSIVAYKNLLPDTFWGNKPQYGEVEIGGKAGDPNGMTLPDISFTTSSNVNLIFGICFDTDPLLFEENKFTKAVGYTFTLVDELGNEVTKTVYKEANRLSDAFVDNPNTGYAQGGSNSDYFFTNLTINHAAKAIVISFMLKANWKIRSFSYVYGDKPQKITNVSLISMCDPLEDYLVLPYNGVDCSSKQYTENVGRAPVYNLDSEYGSVYSENYLLDLFIAKDEYDGSITVPQIEDPNGYFVTGSNAPLGSKYTIYLNAFDKLNNKSTVTINLQVVDKRGPDIFFPHGKKITVPYTVLEDESLFMDEYVLIADNYDTSFTYTLNTLSGSSINPYQIGEQTFVVQATDSSGNWTREELSVTVKDDVAPVITSTADEINITPLANYSQKQLLALFDANDKIDGKLQLSIIEDTYTPNMRKIGKYAFTVKAVDKSGNETTKTLAINVSDNEGPIFYAKKGFITASVGNIPEVEEIISSLVRQEVIEDLHYISWKVIKGEEINKDLSLGLHEMTLLLVSDTQKSERVDLTLNVVESSSLNNTKLSLWDRIKLWFIKLWNKIVAFFKR